MSGKTSKPNEYDDIPGTIVFDAQRARKGYHLNQFLYSLMSADNRKEFLSDERKYLDKFPMTEAQKVAVMKRDWNTLLDLGGVSYALAKLAFTDEHSYQYMAAEMSHMTQKEYADMMIAGGRSLDDGWRYKHERVGHEREGKK
jgi:protocatechuate 4,5-dioxygenase alpha chain